MSDVLPLVAFQPRDLVLIARRRFQAYQTCSVPTPTSQAAKSKPRKPNEDEPPVCTHSFFDMFCGTSIRDHSWVLDAVKQSEWITTPRDMTRAMSLVVNWIATVGGRQDDRADWFVDFFSLQQQELFPGEQISFCIDEESFRDLIKDKPLAAL
jgi:hypothetical protein